MSDASVHRTEGSAAHSCCSILTESSAEAMPSRFLTRSTCRSTGEPGTRSACPSTTLAVFRPTPGNLTRSSMRAGTLPPWRSNNAAVMLASNRALDQRKRVDLICDSNSPGVARASVDASGYLSNNAGVTRLTRLSVHCAERMVATSSSYASRKRSSLNASGCCACSLARTFRVNAGGQGSDSARFPRGTGLEDERANALGRSMLCRACWSALRTPGDAPAVPQSN